MANEIELQQKKEVAPAEERTEAGRFYSPYTDIYETGDTVIVEMDMPGVAKDDVDIRLDKNVLRITGRVDSQRYAALEPLYTEYNVGNFVRSFTLSTAIDRDKISANLADGVLRVELQKAAAAVARRIEVH